MSKLKVRSRLMLSASVAVAGVALQNPAYAQTDAAEAADENIIVVTAQGREENLNDVPVAVSVVSGEALAAQNLVSLKDVADRLPNVKIAAGPFDLLNIRGIGSGNNGGFEQSVATFVDGVYRSRSRATRAALFDVDRVEVLKGPQTTFFGANAIAGAINITSKKPGNEFGYNASALYGTDNTYNLEAGVDVPLGDTLSMRLAGRLHGTDGYVKTPNGKGPAEDGGQARFALKWTPTETWTSNLRLDYGQTNTDNAFPFEVTNCPLPASVTLNRPNNACAIYLGANGPNADSEIDFVSDAPPSFADFEFFETAWTNTLEIGSGSLIFNTGYYWHGTESTFSGIGFTYPNAVGGGPDGFPIPLNEEYKQFSQEIRYQSDTGGVVDYMFGAYFSKAKLDYENYAVFNFVPFGAIAAGPPFFATTNPTDSITGNINYDTNDKTYSAFAAINLRPTDALRVNAGLRYTKFDKFATRNVINGVTTNNGDPSTFVPLSDSDQAAIRAILGSDASDFANNNRSDDRFMPSVSVQYDLSPDVMLYSSYSHGFKAGGFSGAASPITFNPEFVDAYEMGIKGSAANGALNFSLVAFLNDYKGLQEASVIPQGVSLVSVVSNAAGARTKGLELDTSFRASDELSFHFAAAYLSGKYRDYANGVCTQGQQAAVALLPMNVDPGCVQDMTGKTRAYSPKFSGNLAVDVNLPISDDLNINFVPSLFYTSSYFLTTSADPLFKQDGFVKFDARLGLASADDSWSVAIIGKNLFDKATTSFNQPGTFGIGFGRAFADPSRSIAVQFRIKG